MKIEGLGDIQGQCETLIQAKEAELKNLAGQFVAIRQEINGLKRVLRALGGANGQPSSPLKGKRLAVNQNGEPTRGQQVLEILRASTKALHIGDIAKKSGLPDNSQNRTKISAAITPLLKGPQSPVIRVGAGIYAAR